METKQSNVTRKYSQRAQMQHTINDLHFFVLLFYWTNIIREQKGYFGLLLIELKAEFNSLLTCYSNINRV